MAFGRKTIRSAIAEFLAMTLFVWIGPGSAVSNQTQQWANANGAGAASDDFLTAVSLSFGTAIVVLVYAIAPISGGHVNPAVSLSFFLQKKLSIRELAAYWLAQFLGAMLGAAILWGCVASDELEDASDKPPFLLASNFVADFLPLGSAFLIECMGTFLLVFTIMLTAVSPHSLSSNLAPIAIGWSVTLAHYVLIPFTGCGINPARSFGPHVVSSMAGADVGKRGVWIYYTAPFVGSAVATYVGKYLYESEKHLDDEEAHAEREHEQMEKSLISARIPAPTYSRKKEGAPVGEKEELGQVEEEPVEVSKEE